MFLPFNSSYPVLPFRDSCVSPLIWTLLLVVVFFLFFLITNPQQSLLWSFLNMFEFTVYLSEIVLRKRLLCKTGTLKTNLCETKLGKQVQKVLRAYVCVSVCAGVSVVLKRSMTQARSQPAYIKEGHVAAMGNNKLQIKLCSSFGQNITIYHSQPRCGIRQVRTQL